MKFVNVPWYLFMKKMPWYAVARGRNPGIYKTWPECQEQVSNFNGAKYQKFNTETEAINFVNEHGKSDLQYKTQQTHVKRHGENIILQQISSSQGTDTQDVFLSQSSSQGTDTQDVFLSQCGTSEFTNMSSPRLKGKALKQRLSFIEKKYEDSMKELRTEIDTVKESIEKFDTNINIPTNYNAHDKATVTEEFKALQECLSQLIKHVTDCVTELKAEINSLKLAVSAVGLEEQNNAQSQEEEACAGSSSLSFKRNRSLILEAVGPTTTTARSYSTAGKDETKTNKRKISVHDKEAGPSKVVKVEPPDADDKTDSKNVLPGFEVDQDGYVHVYTDGACENNGRVGARAGIGVWFADNHPLNYSERVQGRLTNNTAEIQAATCAIELAKRAGIKNLLIHTDSQFLISCITVWIHKWKQNDWKLSDGGQVKNKEDLMALDEALEGIGVKWDHVRGHRGNHGNEMADALARAGARKRY